MNPLPTRLLVVTDRHLAPRALPEIVADLLATGARWIWLRDRDLPAEERRSLAESLKGLTQRAGACLSIGADAALAARIGAVGLHGGSAEDLHAARRRMGPEALLGLSAHRPADLQAARDAGADYVTLSPVFASASKPGYGPALGLDALAQAARYALPVLALGGVTAATARRCIDAGAAGVAVMGPLMRTPDARSILQALTPGTP